MNMRKEMVKVKDNKVVQLEVLNFSFPILFYMANKYKWSSEVLNDCPFYIKHIENVKLEYSILEDYKRKDFATRLLVLAIYNYDMEFRYTHKLRVSVIEDIMRVVEGIRDIQRLEIFSLVDGKLTVVEDFENILHSYTALYNDYLPQEYKEALDKVELFRVCALNIYDKVVEDF